MSKSRALSIALLVASLGACAGDRPGPTDPVPLGPGPMVIRIEDRPDGIVMLRLVLSGPVQELTSDPSHAMWERNHFNGTRTIILRGPLTEGPVARFQAHDRDQDFQVAVTGAAAGWPGGYALLPDSSVRIVIEPE